MAAKWICHPGDDRETRLVPVFRRRFTIGEELFSARMTLSAHGIYESELNGKSITENRFLPGFTSYYERIQKQEFDVIDLLTPGENEWTVTVGDGWWRWNNNFGTTLALYGVLELEYRDGTVERIETDETFEVGTGPILRTDLQKGEVYDARRTPGEFVPAVLCDRHTDGELIEMTGVPVTEHERFPGRVLQDAAGRTVVDFGQNLAGYVAMTLHDTTPGQVIHLKHGEGLDLNGCFSTANCDGGMEEFQEVTYYCRGGARESYQPHFAVFGFRYLLVEGVDPAKADFTAIAVYSDLMQTGTFHCSDPNIDRLFENALWSQKGNFLDVPVDCPTRERNAWTGDAQIYVKTAAYLMNVLSFFKKWLVDQTLEQYESGKVGITFPSTSSVHDPEELKRVLEKDPSMALAGPTGNGNEGEDSVGWGDSAVWIPYQLYLMYGDRSVLAEHYETAKRWVEYSLRCMEETNPNHLDKPWYQNGDGRFIYDTRFHYGEWNEPLPPPPEVIALFAGGGSKADYVRLRAENGEPEVATAYTKRSCDNLAHMARILGKKKDAERYEDFSRKIRKAYDRYLIGEDGTIQPGHQAPYIRALAMDLVSKQKRPLVLQQLKKELEAADYHLNTGFLSTVYLLPTLCDNGLTEEAYRILEQTDHPGWLHPIMLGATTMLENWDGLDSFRDSFNHYSFGAVCQFLFEYVAGIRPRFDAPGFKRFDLKPVIGGSLTFAEASYQTKYGTIVSRWERQGHELHYTCKVPERTTAYVTLPNRKHYELGAGWYEWKVML